MASKSKSRRRVLRASCLLAALIVAGSSFAWFTSKDEVTNRLSAAANYGVAIAEDFQPPENWVPGQSINKDAGVVNTGNVDAFARVWLEGEMSVIERTSQANSTQVSTAASHQISPVTDTKYTAINLNYKDDSGIYYRELSKDKVKNPDLNDTGTTAESGDDENTPARFSEVQAMQAGAYLSYAPSGANYYFIVERVTNISAYENNTDTSKKDFELKEGDIIATKGATVPTTVSSGHTVVYIDTGDYGLDIDSSDFYPQTEGTYIFRRNVELTKTTAGGTPANGTNEKDDYEYSGYYYVPVNGGTSGLLKAADDTNDHYFALYTDDAGRSDYTIPDNAVEDTATGDVVEPSKNVVKVQPVDAQMKFFNAKEKVVKNDDLKWTYTAPSSGQTSGTLTAYYAGTDGTLGKTRTGSSAADYAFTDTSKDDIVIEVALANLGTNSEQWTAISGTTSGVDYYAPTQTDATQAATTLSTNGKWTFYYNNDIEAGDTTTILVDSVKMSDNTTQYAFLAFDFDLNVFMESAQVTMDEDGKELATAVDPWAATSAKNTAAKPGTISYHSGNANEIDDADWTTT